MQLVDRSSVPEITPLEKHVLQLLAQGCQSKEIAHRVERKKPTVEAYIRILYAKFGAKSRAHLVARAYSFGLME